MEISRTAAGFLVLACVAAGAGVTFLAFRDAPPPLTELAATEAPAPPSAGPVAESEAVIAKPATAKPQAPVALKRRTEPQRAPAPGRRETPPQAQPSPPLSEAVPAQDQPEGAPVGPPLVADNDASRSVGPPAPVYEELVVPADSVIGLRLESQITSERARVEDSVVARVTRDVRVGDRVAIASGARAFGEVTLVERGGRLRDRARLGVRFTSVALADGTRLPIRTEPIYREGDAPARESAAKIGGGTIGGVIIGGILGGAKGAAIGGSIGAGAGTAAVMAGDRNHAVLSAGSPLTVRLEEPLTVTVER